MFLVYKRLSDTQIPHAPSFVEGVIDFRGEVIPVLNMREKFGIDAASNKDFSVIVVIEFTGRIMGITVDGVSDIQNLPKEKIQQTPEFTSREKTKYLRAVGKLKERLILIIDLGKIIDLNEEKKLDELLLPLNEQDNRLVENG